MSFAVRLSLPRLVFVTLQLMLCGCGTVSSRTAGFSGPYHGIGYDFEKIASGDEWLEWSVQGSAGNIPFLCPRGLLWVLDTPLSLVADTLILPFDALRRQSVNAE